MNAPATSVLFFLLASIFGAFGQFLYKSGADRATGDWRTYLFNARILGGVVCYFAVMILFVSAFKRGGALSVLYPIYATTFVWAAVIACLAYGVPIKPIHFVGMMLLITGMFLMGM